jgi:hypothetical protein
VEQEAIQKDTGEEGFTARVGRTPKFYAEMLVGAGGGGGIDTGSALLFKPSIGLEFQLTPSLSLQTGLGRVISKSGNLDSSFPEANLVYRFGTAYR